MPSPVTKIRICQNLGLSSDYRNTFWFNNVSEQRDFFESKVIKNFNNYAHVRKNWTLKIEAHISLAEKWGYLFFQHFNSGKYYYYFIKNSRYISEETTELELELDVMQTYMFDYALQPCFVEREHSASDNIGDNTVDEDLELGLMKNGDKNTPDVFNGNLSLMMMTTQKLPVPATATFPGKIIDGIYSACPIYRIKVDNDTMANSVFNYITANGLTDSIVSLWLMPHGLVDVADDEADYSMVNSSKFEGVNYYPPVLPSTIDGYTPKNKKLFTFPFCYLYGTNNAGSSAIYRYERFENGVAYFNIEASVFPDGGIKVTPLNYNGSGVNYDEALNLSTLPTCPWVGDPYKIWLAQNQNQQATSQFISGTTALGGAGVALAGLFTGNLMLAGTGLAH